MSMSKEKPLVQNPDEGLFDAIHLSN